MVSSAEIQNRGNDHPYNEFDPSTVPVVWFDDGNLIIAAEDSQFRISKGILAARSTVFEGMLSLPQRGIQQEQAADGCPIVRVHDSPQEMGWFLKAIYDSSFFEPPPTPTHMTIIASILRMGSKYDVPYLRRRAIRHLELLYPTSLDSFDERQEKRTTPWTDNTAFFASNLARELDLPWLLPSCLLCVCSCPVESIADGFTWNKTTTLSLHPANRSACLKAIVRLSGIEHRETLAFLTTSTNSHTCQRAGPSEVPCNATRLNILHLLNDCRKGINPIDAVFKPVWEYYKQHVCPSCYEDGKTLYAAARRRLWDSLPEIFGLPNWDTLKRMREEEMRVDMDLTP